MENTTTITLILDGDIADKLIELAKDESRLDQYLAIMLKILAKQPSSSDSNNEILLEHMKMVNALIEKLNQSQAEILTLRNQLRQVIATNQDLLALRNPP